LLIVDGDALAHLREGAEALVFDLANAAKALAQFEHSSEVVAFDFVGSQEATEQFEQATEVEEAFLVRCLCLCVDCFATAFGVLEQLCSHRTWLMPGCARWCPWLREDVTSLHAILSCNLWHCLVAAKLWLEITPWRLYNTKWEMFITSTWPSLGCASC